MANPLNEKEQLIDLERLFNEKQYEDALALAEELKKEFNESFQVNLLYAKILRTVKQYDKAEPVLIQLLASHPDNLNVLLETAALSVDMKKFAQAKDYYNKILFIDSFNTQAKEALSKLEKAAEEPPPGAEEPEVTEPEETGEEPDTEKKPWRDDTLPEETLDKIEDLMSDSETEGDAEITEESIKVEDEAVHVPVKPTIPGVDEAYVSDTANEVDKVSTEAVEDFFVETPDESKSGDVSTEKAPTTGEDFITESAAQLYVSQGLYEEALFVYEKLYQNSKDDRYVSIIEDLKVKCIGQKKIQALTAFLEIIQRRSE